MTQSVAIQMDPLETIKPAGDSTLALALEGQKRGYTTYAYTPDKLTYENGVISARAHAVTFYDRLENFYEYGDEKIIDLRDMDMVWLRQDPPFDMSYITTTYLLEKLMPDVCVFNNPAAVRDIPEKIFPSLFDEYAPPTLISADPVRIEAFWREHKDIVMKPLYGFGGHGVFRLAPKDKNFHALLETHFSQSNEPLVAQAFLPDVKEGERRIIFIDGEVAGLFGRIPAKGEIRSNMRVGGTPVKAELTLKQQEICDAIGPMLKEMGLLLVGLDVIGDHLIEVNTTCPTGLRALDKLYGMDSARLVWDAAEDYLP